MTRNHEKLLVAVLAGFIIAGAGLFAIQPVTAQGMSATASSRLAAPAPAVLDLRLFETV